MRVAFDAIKVKLRESYSKAVVENMVSTEFQGEADMNEAGMRSFPFDFYRYDGDEAGYSPELSRIPFPNEDDMADFDHWLDIQVKRKMEELLLRALNEDGHTPLTLAAVLGKRDMLAVLCAGDFQWSYGPLSVSRINLEGFEKPIDTSMYSRPIRVPVYRYFYTIPTSVLLIISAQWNGYAFKAM